MRASTRELRSGWYKQVVVLPSGFADTDRDTFFSEFDRGVSLMTSGATAGSSWSVQRRDQILFIAYFLAGGALGTADATFGGQIARHPIRGYALSLSNQSVYSMIASIRRSTSGL